MKRLLHLFNIVFKVTVIKNSLACAQSNNHEHLEHGKK